MYTFVFGLGTRIFQVLIGPLAILLLLVVFVCLNIASLGATYTAPVLTAFRRFLHHLWSGGAHSPQHPVFRRARRGTDILRLRAWTAEIAGLVLPVSRKLERKRERPVVAGGFRPPARPFARRV